MENTKHNKYAIGKIASKYMLVIICSYIEKEEVFEDGLWKINQSSRHFLIKSLTNLN